MTKRRLLIVARLFFGLLTLTAIVTQLVIHLQHGFNVVNFFSYFTNLSTIFASVVLLIGAIYLLQRREPTATDDIIRGSAVAKQGELISPFYLLSVSVRAFHISIPSQLWARTSRGERMRSGCWTCQAAKAIT